MAIRTRWHPFEDLRRAQDELAPDARDAGARGQGNRRRHHTVPPQATTAAAATAMAMAADPANSAGPADHLAASGIWRPGHRPDTPAAAPTGTPHAAAQRREWQTRRQ
jgi:hypothetical protein